MSLFTEEIKVKAEELEYNAVSNLKSFPTYKKVLLIFFVAGLIPVYILTRFLSQAYWTDQYKNFAISARPSFTQSKSVTVGQVGVLPVSENIYSGYAYVTNPNLDLSVKDARYTFSFFSASGSEVATADGQFFMLPNEKKYLIASRVESSEPIARATVSFKDLNWQKKISIPSVKVTATKPLLFDQFDPPALTAQGSVVNNTAYLLSGVRIVFLLYDASNRLVAASQRDEFTLKPNERRTYNQLWPNLQTGKVASIEVIAETNPLDTKNLSPASSPVLPSGASDLSRPQNNNQ